MGENSSYGCKTRRSCCLVSPREEAKRRGLDGIRNVGTRIERGVEGYMDARNENEGASLTTSELRN